MCRNLILKSFKTISSHLQLRGSVPSFWEQPGINFGQHKCDIIRKTEGSISAARRHFQRIAQLYSNCHVVNLLGKGDGESKVSNQYEEIVNQLQVRFQGHNKTKYPARRRITLYSNIKISGRRRFRNHRVYISRLS